jgi:quercetin dioxygenase-like cupin family protein
MKSVCYGFSSIAVFAFSLCLSQGLAADEATSKVSRENLLKKRVTLSSKEIDTQVIRVRFPKAYKTPLHTHEGPGPRYVLKGKLKVEDSHQSSVYVAGEVFWETGEAMTIENVGKGEAEIVIFEMLPIQPHPH